MVLVAGVVAIEFGGDTLRQALRFDRGPIGHGEVVRLLSAHFTHLGWPHALLNIAGLLLVWALVGAAQPVLKWLIVILTAIVSIDLGLWFGVPELSWYLGLSGVLHGLLAGGIVAMPADRRIEAVILGTVLSAKIVYEASVGPLPGSEATAGGSVVTEAHLFGAIGGGLAGLAMRLSARS